MSTADVSVLIVAFGSDELLDGCLGALGEGTRPTVVDNASRRQTRAICDRHGARYLDAGGNLGFSGGVNIGLAALNNASDVLLLNPDARVEAADIAALHRQLHDQGGLVAAVAPAQQHPVSGQNQRVTWPFPRPARQWLVAAGLGRLLHQEEFLIGSVLLIKRAALNDVGPFDERYFLYCEETDWQRRAQERGWSVELVPEVTAYHVGAGTSSDSVLREAYFHAGHELYIRKWFGRRGWWLYRAAYLCGDVIRAVTGGARARSAKARLAIYREGPVRHRDRLLAESGG